MMMHTILYWILRGGVLAAVLAVLLIVPGRAAGTVTAGPAVDLTGEWGYVYSVGGPPFVGACVTTLAQTGGAVTSTVNMECESSGSPTATGGAITGTVSGLAVSGQVAFSGPIGPFLVTFTGTASSDASGQQGSWEVPGTIPLVNGTYVGLRLIPTATGTSVAVVVPPSPETGSGATVTFDEVTGAGGTQVIQGSPTGGVLPDNFRLEPEGTIYNVVSSATFTGDINVCINYQDKDDDGLVDGTSPPMPETALRLLHDESGVFIDRTDATKTDFAANRVCGIVSSLSEFAVGVEASVGGIAELPDVEGTALEAEDSSGLSAGEIAGIAAGAAAVAIALSGGAWYVRRRVTR